VFQGELRLKSSKKQMSCYPALNFLLPHEESATHLDAQVWGLPALLGLLLNIAVRHWEWSGVHLLAAVRASLAFATGNAD